MAGLATYDEPGGGPGMATDDEPGRGPGLEDYAAVSAGTSLV